MHFFFVLTFVCFFSGDSSAFLIRGGEAVPISVDHKISTPSERARVSLVPGVTLAPTATRIPGGLAISRALGDHFLKGEVSPFLPPFPSLAPFFNVLKPRLFQLTGLIGEPYVSPAFVVEPSDSFVVLASDGLWDIIDGKTCADFLSAQPPSTDCSMLSQALLNMALAARACTDNVTVVVVRLN